MLKVGIIGFGKMGILHGALVNGTKKAEVVAICDMSWVMRFGVKKVYPKAKTFKDIDVMLNTVDLDVVIISTPTFNHVESAIKCIEKGCHVFIEKPLAATYEDALKIMNAAEQKGVFVQVGFCNRFAPSIAKGKRLLEEGKIGEIKEADACMYIADVFEAHKGWRYKKSLSGGGALMDFGIHMLDQLCWYLGEASEVEATKRQLYSVEVEDEVDAKITFKNGVIVNYKTSWSKEGYRKSYASATLYGSKGKMVVTDQTLDVYDNDGLKIEEFVFPDLYDGTYMDVGGILYSKQMECFFNIIDNEEKSNIDGAVYDQFLIEKIYESASNSKKVCF